MAIGLMFVPQAILHQSRLFGYVATGSFLNALGFNGAIYPFCYVIGWSSEDLMARTSTASLLAMVIFVLFRLARCSSRYLQPFVSSVSVLGGITHYLALLIMSNMWYERDNSEYIGNNLRMLVSLVVAQYVGNVYDMTGLANTATTFSVLWILEKVHEFHHTLKLNGWIMVFAGSFATYFMALWLHAHPAFVASLFRSMEWNPVRSTKDRDF